MLRLAMMVVALLSLAVQPSQALDSQSISVYSGRQALEWRGVVVDLNVVMPYYDGNGYQPVWVSGRKLTKRADALLEAISRAEEDGLDSKDYLPLAFAKMVGLKDEADAAGFELAMSAAFMNFARDLHAGRTTPAVTEPDIIIARKEADGVKWLSIVARSGVSETLQALRPQHVQYFQLKQLLAGYRALAGRGGWPQVNGSGAVKPGMTSPIVSEMRRNLTARGYSGINTANPDFYDDGLKAVVQHFQKRHGLDTDGVAGAATFRAMDISADERVRQIIVNMERWRWVPVDLGTRHILVNQAAFEMDLVDNGKVLDRRRVIVGKPFHKTPIFSDKMEYAEFNPTWTVPQSIATKEMLPKLREDPSYTERNDFSIYKGWGNNAPLVSPYLVDWSSVSSTGFPYRIVQNPGPKNALGQVKFIFPNKFDVYLHDTPSRQLFAKTGRAFSHGCIRVHDPLEFASILFGLDQGMKRPEIDRIVGTDKQTRVSLKRKVDVHLTYFTVWVDENGIPYFFDDVYERDKLVANLLFGNV